jgi:hypothetical protein
MIRLLALTFGLTLYLPGIDLIGVVMLIGIGIGRAIVALADIHQR